MEHADVVIVGAGAAGLAAARDLSGTGLRVVVLEARQRMGGRIETVRPPGCAVAVELGAEFIHGQAEETLRVARAAGVPAVEIPDVHWRRTPRGFETRDFWGTVARVLSRVPKRGDRSAAEFLRSLRRVAPADRRLVRSFVEGYHAAPLDAISARSIALDREDAAPGANPQFRILDGQDRLIEWLAAGCDPDTTSIRTGTAVARVDWTARGVALSDAGGRSIRAAAAVITVPLGVLHAPAGSRGAIRFVPDLPPAFRRALGKVAMASVVKITLRFREAFWERDGFLERRLSSRRAADPARLVFLHDAEAAFPTWWTAAPARVPLLTAWAGGPAAAARRARAVPPEEVAIETLARLLRMRRAELESQLAAAWRRDWTADPFSRGAYSYARPGGASAARVLARPAGARLLFAGEATAADETGTVAGALSSGRRAARELRSIFRLGRVGEARR